MILCPKLLVGLMKTLPSWLTGVSWVTALEFLMCFLVERHGRQDISSKCQEALIFRAQSPSSYHPKRLPLGGRSLPYRAETSNKPNHQGTFACQYIRIQLLLCCVHADIFPRGTRDRQGLQQTERLQMLIFYGVQLDNRAIQVCTSFLSFGQLFHPLNSSSYPSVLLYSWSSTNLCFLILPLMPKTHFPRNFNCSLFIPYSLGPSLLIIITTINSSMLVALS